MLFNSFSATSFITIPQVLCTGPGSDKYEIVMKVLLKKMEEKRSPHHISQTPVNDFSLFFLFGEKIYNYNI